jgi:hypothetical protein
MFFNIFNKQTNNISKHINFILTQVSTYLMLQNLLIQLLSIERWKRLFAGTPPAFKNLFAGTPSVFKSLFDGTPPSFKNLFAGTPPAFKNLFAGTLLIKNSSFAGIFGQRTTHLLSAGGQSLWSWTNHQFKHKYNQICPL